MDTLFDHPGFRLIFVDDDGSMSLVTPIECKEDVIKGYRCISHLWGNATRWEGHPVKNVSWGVDVREEKRNKLLQIFNHYKGYWWMDVFCTDQESSNKPLSIMGDVYKNCRECVCMLDIEIPNFIRQPPESPTMKDFHRTTNHMSKILDCKWNKRVWTFQEARLPSRAFYTEETDKRDFFIVDFMSIESFTFRGLETVPKIIEIAYTIFSIRTKMGYQSSFESAGIDNDIMYLIRSGRTCKNPEDYYYGIAGALNISLKDGLTLEEIEKEFLERVNEETEDVFVTRNKSIGRHGVYKSWKITYKRGWVHGVLPFIFGM